MDDGMKELKDFSKKEKEKILAEAQKRFKTLHDANYELKLSFIKNMKFSFNIEEGQWNAQDIKIRDESENPRPHLTSNKLGKFVAQVVNQEKGMPEIDDVIPVDSKGDIEIAKIYNELISDIQYQSSVEEIYGIAGKQAVGGGYGFWRFITEYTDDGFDQVIRYKPIKNPLNVDVDPRGMFAFIREAMPTEEYERLNPGKDKSDFIESEYDDLWYEEDKVMIAEYYRKVPIKKTIVETYNPQTEETEVYEITEDNEKEIRKLQILRERKADSFRIDWFKLSGHELLDYTEWPGKYIPIVEVVGDEVYLEGRTYKKALTTDAQSPQQMYNYWLTSMTEKVALSPKAPFIIDPHQIKGYETMWNKANIENRPFLFAKTINGKSPERTPAPQIDAGSMTMLQIANNDINDVLGRYEASSGATSNERSGKAIDARNARSDLTAYTFSDNFKKAKIRSKRILIDLIPKVYDNQRVIRLRNEDTTVEINKVILNEKMEKVIINDLSKGSYDMRTRSVTNPSKREQISGTIERALQYAGELYAPVLLPLLFEYSDAPGADKILAAIQQIANKPPEKGEGKPSEFEQFM
jgi:hypothetical protein